MLSKILAEYAGHTGIAGGQFLDLNFEKKKIPIKKIVDMQIKKTGRLFSFCCVAPGIISEKGSKIIKEFESIGSNIGLLFQIVDDLIDYRGDSVEVGKKTKKDKAKGKATLISLLGYKNTIKYANKLKFEINKKIKKYGNKSNNLIESLDFIFNRAVWKNFISI